ncbi:helix-turn-helix transcriptional regulator [Tepidibacter hydrothermalis]|uniref:WYL domain-containing protein n=1 Tax=Tepidibacter hydrothermalis TaxID=3036126 RepID=A0ABY8ED61_9FIRM|nr:WYL domain-containing protein [Tepidibacter hydrothermalis]WFD10880.1 WYL domain-containing protein [Tepidibacter hydrothermalis]
MSSNSNLKLKPLYIMKILLEKTDEKHFLTVNDIISELKKHDIPSERKSIYSDIELLKSFGIDIICEKGRANKYYIGSREFELPELKLLVDAVQSSKFITAKKSTELIKKIEKLASIYEAKELHRQVFVSDRVKTVNEAIYYNVDAIHKAIQENKKVAFKYFEYDTDKKIKFRRNGEKYIVSPYALTWENGNYYLISYYERYENISNFRVDRMNKIEIIDEDRFMIEDGNKFDVADYSNKIFNMFSGDIESVELQFDNSLINVVIDRFGKEVFINKKDENSFSIKVEVAESSTFYGWLFMFGNRVRILSPQWLVDTFKEKIEEVRANYE